jgi:hypothetical protein
LVASDDLEAGIYRGETATRGSWNTFFEAFERVVVEPLEFIEHGECVAVPHHFHAWGQRGVEVDALSTVVFTVRPARCRGLPARLRLHLQREIAKRYAPWMSA